MENVSMNLMPEDLAASILRWQSGWIEDVIGIVQRPDGGGRAGERLRAAERALRRLQELL